MRTLLYALFVGLVLCPPAISQEDAVRDAGEGAGRICSFDISDVTTYDRAAQYGRWRDADSDCQNTRHEVLIEESLNPVTLSNNGCSVTAGRWYDPYTGQYFANPRDLDIDHVVPLYEAHMSGAYAWLPARRRAFANDISHPASLMAVDNSTNRSKGAKDPAEWLPPNTDYHCEYIITWTRIKDEWNLCYDEQEWAVIEPLYRQCYTE